MILRSTLSSSSSTTTTTATALLLPLLLSSLSQATTILLPPSSGAHNSSGIGKYPTRISTTLLTDTSRLDPYAPSHNTPRSVIISAFVPVSNHTGDCRPLSVVEYMPNTTAEYEDESLKTYGGVTNATLENFGFLSCRPRQQNTSDSIASASSDSFPLILFSPGFGVSRLLYSAIGHAIASAGFTVVTIDHPYDGDIVEFPNGTVVHGIVNATTDAQSAAAVATRVKDVSFVLDRLSSAADQVVENVIPRGAKKGGFDVGRTGMFGHSIGGATAAAAMLADRRIIGGVNMDGALYGPVVQDGLDRPFLILNGVNHTRFTDASWAQAWPNLRGWKRELLLKGSRHLTFSDYPLLLKLLGFEKFASGSLGSQLLGELDGRRAFEVVTAYLVAFFEFVLKGRERGILDGPSERYPEIAFVN